MKRFIKRFRNNEFGVSMAEYSVLIGIVTASMVITILAVLTALGG